ncbi:MAG: hypothetical protein S4CHLAM6_14260 [Chlamydiae bacterium]|nr:hypothetical protein [Chlamydiota bacterium]
MRNPLLDTNFGLYNLLNTIAFGVIIFTLVVTNIRSARNEKNPCKFSMLTRLLVALAFALLIISTWISLPC